MADSTQPNAAQGGAANPVAPGDVLAGKYRVERVLGKGGMGLVVAAMHLQLEQLVALKFLLPDALKNPEVVGRFAREARAAVKLQSEHVARVSDVGALEGGSPFMVMEYLEGTDLAKTIDKDGAFEVEQAVDYLLQACEAIAEAHALGIVHRDLKPSNLFVARRSDKRQIIKVLDFGISKLMSGAGETAEGSLTRTTDVLGSPMYMSPEQLRLSRSVDARTDIWSLGVILFELLTLEVPFQVGTLAEICGAILHEQPKLLGDVRADVPDELEAIVARCLEKDPRHRYGSVAELAEALEPFGSEAAALSVTQIARFAPPPAEPDVEALKQTAVERPTLPEPRTGARTTGRRTVTGGGGRESTASRRRGGAASISQAKATNTSWDGKLPERPAPSRSFLPWIASVILLAGAGVAAWKFGVLAPLGVGGPKRGVSTPTAVVAAPAPTAKPTPTATAAPSATAAEVASAAASAAPSAAPTGSASASAAANTSAAARAAASASAKVASGAPGASGKAKAGAPASTLAAAIAAWGKVPDAPPATAAPATPPAPPAKPPDAP